MVPSGFSLSFTLTWIVIIVIVWTIITSFSDVIISYFAVLFNMDPDALSTKTVIALVILAIGVFIFYLLDYEIVTVCMGVNLDKYTSSGTS
jgi:hypothetical protein